MWVPVGRREAVLKGATGQTPFHVRRILENKFGGPNQTPREEEPRPPCELCFEIILRTRNLGEGGSKLDQPHLTLRSWGGSPPGLPPPEGAEWKSPEEGGGKSRVTWMGWGAPRAVGEAADGPSRLGEMWGDPARSQGRGALIPSEVIKLEKETTGVSGKWGGRGRDPPPETLPPPVPYSVQRVITKVGLLGLAGAPPSVGASMAQESR